MREEPTEERPRHGRQQGRRSPFKLLQEYVQVHAFLRINERDLEKRSERLIDTTDLTTRGPNTTPPPPPPSRGGAPLWTPS